MGGIPGSDVEEWKHAASPAGAEFLCGAVHSTSHPHHTQLQDRQEHNRWVDKDAVHGRRPGHIRLPGSFHGGHHERLGDACLHCDSAPAPPSSLCKLSKCPGSADLSDAARHARSDCHQSPLIGWAGLNEAEKCASSATTCHQIDSQDARKLGKNEMRACLPAGQADNDGKGCSGAAQRDIIGCCRSSSAGHPC